jgi:hypothetical protein
MRRTTHLARLASVSAVALALSGCAARTVELPADAPRAHVAARPGRPGTVVAAAQGAPDTRTGEIAAEIARRTGFGLVVATGPALEAFGRSVREIAQGPLRFYAEIHGNNHRDAAGRIEIATVGIDREHALRLRTLVELIRDAHLRGNVEAPRLEVLIAPADTLRYAAAGAAWRGLLWSPGRGLHIELPRAARHEWRELYTTILADFIAQAVALPAGR